MRQPEIKIHSNDEQCAQSELTVRKSMRRPVFMFTHEDQHGNRDSFEINQDQARDLIVFLIKNTK